MSTNDSDVDMHRSIEDDAEFRILYAATVNEGEPSEYGQFDCAVCTECKRGDVVTTEKRRKDFVTLRRHTCTECGEHGATVIERSYGPDPAEYWTGGGVKTVDLEAESNEEYRGTF